MKATTIIHITCASFKQALKCTIFVFSVYGMLGGVFDLVITFPPDTSLYRKLATSAIYFGLIYIALFSLCYFYFWIHSIFLRKVKVTKLNTHNSLYVIYDDIFKVEEKLSKKRDNKCCNILISCNPQFDTQVGPHKVSPLTLHGKTVERILKKTNYSPDFLREKLIEYIHYTEQEFDKNDSPTYFRPGTIAQIIVNKTEYFFWALSKFNQEGCATTTFEEYCLALSNLVPTISLKSEGVPFLIPLIGTGLSKLNLQENTALQFLTQAIISNKSGIYCDIYIVIPNHLKHTISIPNYV